MADEIRVDYPQLEQVAAQFARQATAVNQTQQRVKRQVGQLRSAWVGKGSGAFYAEMNDKVLPATERLYRALQEASKTTRQIAQLMEQAENDAAAPFKAGEKTDGDAATGAGAGTAGVPVQDLQTRWGNLTDAERKQALEYMADDIAGQYGMKHLPVSVEQIKDPPGADARGSWNGSRIRVDVDNLKDPDIIETVAHESRHAVQENLGDKASPGLWDRLLRRVGLQDEPKWPQYGITKETAQGWAKNYDNYKSPPKAYDPKNPDSVRRMNDYLNQPIEKDARKFGSEYFDGMTGADLDQHLTNIL